MRWYRELVAKKHDGSTRRGPGRPRKLGEIAELVEQMARTLVDGGDGFLVGKGYLLIDRDPLYTGVFRRIRGRGGVRTARLPARSPNLNAFAKRFVLSIQSECLERMVPLGEGHPRRATTEYVAHCHRERNHQGLGNVLIDGAEVDSGRAGRIVRRDRLGDLVHFYHRRASASGRAEQWDRTRVRVQVDA